MKVYEYRCKGCGLVLEKTKLRSATYRHMVNDKVCGTMVRMWNSVTFNKIPGGGRV